MPGGRLEGAAPLVLAAQQRVAVATQMPVSARRGGEGLWEGLSSAGPKSPRLCSALAEMKQGLISVGIFCHQSKCGMVTVEKGLCPAHPAHWKGRRGRGEAELEPQNCCGWKRSLGKRPFRSSIPTAATKPWPQLPCPQPSWAPPGPGDSTTSLPGQPVPTAGTSSQPPGLCHAAGAGCLLRGEAPAGISLTLQLTVPAGTASGLLCCAWVPRGGHLGWLAGWLWAGRRAAGLCGQLPRPLTLLCSCRLLHHQVPEPHPGAGGGQTEFALPVFL